ncbi:MAG: hypothetical protein RIR21_151 [Pseudomonadota bacterium]|jgi:hypothetical protein
MKTFIQLALKKTVATSIVLLLMSPLAHAEWVRMFQNIHGTAYYMDPTSVEHHGSMRRVWEMESFKEATKEGLRSIRLYKEYDCKKELGHFKKYVAHTGPEATGEIMGHVETPSQWKTVNASPANKLVFSEVCKDYKP